jgi:hypothetical protein
LFSDSLVIEAYSVVGAPPRGSSGVVADAARFRLTPQTAAFDFFAVCREGMTR